MSYLFFDLILAALLLVFLWRGYARGLVLTLCGLLAVFVALIGATLVSDALAQPVADAIQPVVERGLRDSVESYYQTNMDFLKKDVQDYFFRQEPQIYSKAYDLPPAKYNAGSDVRNSLIASGCIINSKVEHSVLFKKVFVGNNSVIKNSIILNGAYIGDNVHVENCIVESRDTIRADSDFRGGDEVKIVVEKNERYVL